MLFPRDLLENLKVAQWGYTAEVQPHSYENYTDWVDEGLSTPLHYLEDHRKEARQSLTSVLPKAQSAVVFLFNYHPQKLALVNWLKKKKSPLKMASYLFGFRGRDYHDEIKERLEELGSYLKKENPDLEYRACLDIHPVLERDLALRAGLGWFGKNSMLISQKIGSFTIIGSLVLNQKLDGLRESRIDIDHCGQCRACIDACPTDAIVESKRQIIASKCISTFTIEMFKEEAIAPQGMDKANGEIFGCDICQDVCPWNKRPVRMGLEPQSENVFLKENKLVVESFLEKPFEAIIEDLEALSNGAYKRKFKGTPLERTGRLGMLKNLKFWFQLKKP